MNLDGNFPTYEKQEAIKSAVDAIKTTADITKTGVDTVNTKQDQLAQNLNGINTKIGKMDSPFEVGKFIPFQHTNIIGVTGWSSVYKVTGAGMLDLALAKGTSGNAAIRVIVDGVTLVESPGTADYIVGVLPNGEWNNIQGGYLQAHVFGNASENTITPTGTYTAGATTASRGVLWIARPIKFNTSLEILIYSTSGANYRIQGGIFV